MTKKIEHLNDSITSSEVNAISDYFRTLTDYELIMLDKYRSMELSQQNRNLLNDLINKRQISTNEITELLKKHLKSQENNATKCPRCKTTRIINEDPHQNFITFFYAMKYMPFRIFNKYSCTICRYRFRKLISFSEIRDLFIKQYF